MAQPVRSRDWRSRTNEVRSETLPQEIKKLLLAMADKINALERKVFDLTNRLDPIESGIRAVAAEAAKRVA